MKIGRFGELVPVRGFSRQVVRSQLLGQRSAWVSHDGLRVISGREDSHLPGSGEPPLIGPQWLVTVSRAPAPGAPRCTVTDDDIRRVITAFAMPAFDEDNHHPGIARHLWCPIDEQYRNACECKLTEVLVVEADGYQWTTDHDGACRGCEYEQLTGLPCTVHSNAGASS